MTTTVRTKATRAVAAIAAAGALAFGANAITSGDSSSASTGTGGAPSAQAGQGMPAGMGSEVSATTLARLKALVLTKYDGATVERAMKLDDGSYVVHVVKSGGSEVHVLVSSAFKITGTETGPPNGGTPPSGTASGTT